MVVSLGNCALLQVEDVPGDSGGHGRPGKPKVCGRKYIWGCLRAATVLDMLIDAYNSWELNFPLRTTLYFILVYACN